MSWSVSVVGKAKAARCKAWEDFAKIKCAEPEMSFATGLALWVDGVLSTFPEDQPVKIQASGSQSQAYGKDGKQIEGKFSHFVSLTIECIWGFVE